MALLADIIKEKLIDAQAAAVYHRDYIRTKDERYRKYDPKKYEQQKHKKKKKRKVTESNEAVERQISTARDLIQELLHGELVHTKAGKQDLHVLLTLDSLADSSQVMIREGNKVQVAFFFDTASGIEIVEKFVKSFGQPISRKSTGSIAQSVFKDRLTGSTIKLVLDKSLGEMVAYVLLKINEQESLAESVYDASSKIPTNSSLPQFDDELNTAIINIRSKLVSLINTNDQVWRKFSKCETIEDAAEFLVPYVKRYHQDDLDEETLKTVAMQFAETYYDR